MDEVDKKLFEVIRRTLYNYYLKIPNRKNRSRDDYRAIFKQCLKDAVIDCINIDVYIHFYSKLDFECGDNKPIIFIPRYMSHKNMCDQLNDCVNRLTSICKRDVEEALEIQSAHQQFTHNSEDTDTKHIIDIDSISFNSIKNIKF